MASKLTDRFILYHRGLSIHVFYLLCPSVGYVENTEINLRYISKETTRNKEQLIIPYPSKILPNFDTVCHWQKEYSMGTGRVRELSGNGRALPGPGGMEKESGEGRKAFQLVGEWGQDRAGIGAEVRMACTGKRWFCS